MKQKGAVDAAWPHGWPPRIGSQSQPGIGLPNDASVGITKQEFQGAGNENPFARIW